MARDGRADVIIFIAGEAKAHPDDPEAQRQALVNHVEGDPSAAVALDRLTRGRGTDLPMGAVHRAAAEAGGVGWAGRTLIQEQLD